MTELSTHVWRFERGEPLPSDVGGASPLARLVAALFDVEPDLARFAFVERRQSGQLELVTPGYLLPDATLGRLRMLCPLAAGVSFTGRIAAEPPL